MSEQEFDLYLSLLSRFLRLNPDQRLEIADELRDHLAERLEELTAGGLSREEAIYQALSEFGDAADLAAHFSQLARRRTRRLIMRCTVGTVAVTATLIFFANAFWPENPALNGPPRVVAQDMGSVPREASAKPAQTPSKSQSVIEKRRAEIEAMLQGPTELELFDAPLGDGIDQIREQHEIDILIDKRFFEDEGIDLNAIVNFQLGKSAVTLRTALEVILEQADADAAGIIIRDGFLYITAKDKDLTIEVYNCRDLLEGVEGKLVHVSHGAVVPLNSGGQGSGFFSVMQSGVDGGSNAASEEKGRSQDKPVLLYRQSPGEALIEVLTTTVQPESWEDLSIVALPRPTIMGGTIEEFNGLLIIRASQNVHREVKQLLEMMREAAKESTGHKRSVRGAMIEKKRSGSEREMSGAVRQNSKN